MIESLRQQGWRGDLALKLALVGVGRQFLDKEGVGCRDLWCCCGGMDGGFKLGEGILPLLSWG